jgi:hypothetical protein
MLTLKVTKRSGASKTCPQEDCDYSEPVDNTPGDSEEADD